MELAPNTVLKDWIYGLPSAEARAVFAARCETSFGHLRNIAYGKKCAPELASLIDMASAGAVRRWHLRPLDWHRIWPELVGIEGAPEPVAADAQIPATEQAEG